MIVKKVSCLTPEENIAFDDVLLARAERGLGGEVLRFWESGKPFIVLGKTSKPEDDICIEAVVRDGIPVVRRSSGGGTVMQGRGCLNYSLILSLEKRSYLRTIRGSYDWVLSRVIYGLRGLNVAAAFKPLVDIVCDDERKCSGNAQRRGKRAILHHGTILYDFQLEDVERYLALPRQMPEYRRARPHRHFLANIGRQVDEVERALCETFGAIYKDAGMTPDEEFDLRGRCKKHPYAVTLHRYAAVAGA